MDTWQTHERTRETVIAAQPGRYLLFGGTLEQPLTYREPIIAWNVIAFDDNNGDRRIVSPQPITANGGNRASVPFAFHFYAVCGPNQFFAMREVDKPFFHIREWDPFANEADCLRYLRDWNSKWQQEDFKKKQEEREYLDLIESQKRPPIR